MAKVCFLARSCTDEGLCSGIPRADCKAHRDKKCLLRKIWDKAKLGMVVTIEGDN